MSDSRKKTERIPGCRKTLKSQVVVIFLSGDLTTHEMPEFARQTLLLKENVFKSVPGFVLDLEGMIAINSSVIGMIVNFWLLARRRNKDVVLLNCNERVLKSLLLIQLDLLLLIFDDLGAAEASLLGQV